MGNLHTNTSKREINSDLYTITIMSSENVFLIWGGEGWVAGHLKTLLESQGKKVFTTTVRMQNREAAIAEIEKYKPTHILNAAGSTGRPNVDWCEDHKEETIRNNVIILRLRMPVSDDLHSRNFVTKIAKYDRVVDIPNSNTILHDLLPAAILMAEHKDLGIYNFTNPGAISHNEVLSLFKEYVRPDFTWKNFTLDEQAKVIKAGRSNCELDTTKLVNKLAEYNFKVPEIHEAYKGCFQRMAKAGVK